MTTSNATHRTGSLGRTQIVWLAFMAAMTAFGAFFVFTSPTALTAPKAAIAAPVTNGDTGIHEGVAANDWLQIVIHDSGLHFEDHESIDRRVGGYGGCYQCVSIPEAKNDKVLHEEEKHVFRLQLGAIKGLFGEHRSTPYSMHSLAFSLLFFCGS